MGKPSTMIIRLLSFTLLVCLSSAQSTWADDEDTPKAIYNYMKWDCKIDGNKAVLKVKHRITINNVRGDSHKWVSVSEDKFSKLKKLSATVFDATGKQLYKRSKKEFSKHCGFGQSSLYNDVCVYQSSFEAAHYPYTIEYEYTLELKSLFAWRGAVFQSDIPVEHISYTLDIPSDFLFQYQVSGMDLQPTITRDKKRQNYSWEAYDIEPLATVKHVPPGVNEPVALQLVPDKFNFGKYSLDECTWKEIGAWYGRLAEDKYLEASNDDWWQGDDVHAAAGKAYADVTRSTRYVAIQIGIGGWQPYSAKTTRERGYGDCKDMSTLLISKLRHAGIKAYPCLVLTRDVGLMDNTFPNLQFNHVITVAVHGSDTMWMDPTCNNCPYGDLRADVENLDVLVVTDSGGEVWRTPTSTPEENMLIRVTSLELNKDMSLNFATHMEVRGNYAARLRGGLLHMDSDEQRRYVNRIFPGADERYRIESFEIKNLEKIELPLTINTRGRFLKKPRKLGGSIYLDPYLYGGLSRLERVDIESREYGLDLYYPELEEDSITVVWSESLEVDSVILPGNDSLLASFGEIIHVATQSDRSVSILLRKEYSAYQIEVEEFEAFKEFRRKFKDITSSHIKLRIMTAKP